MGFGSGSGSNSPVSSASDVALNNPADTQVFTFDGITQKWKNASAPSALVSSVAGKTGAVVLAKADVNLGNVDNTADVDKPISTATQTALDTKGSRITLGAFQLPARATTGSGEWTGGISYSSSATSSTIAYRTSGGTLAAANAIAANDLVTKSQHDTKLDASQKAIANGVASLDTNGRVPTAQLGTGTADNTTYLRGDGSWQIVQGGGGGSTPGATGAPGAMTIREDTSNPGMYVISSPLDSSAVSLLHGPKQTVDILGKSAAIMFVGDSTSRVSNGSAIQFANALSASNPNYTVRLRQTSTGDYPAVQTWTIGQPTVIQTGTSGERFATMAGSGGLSLAAGSFVRTSPDLDLRIKVAATGWVGSQDDRQTLIAQRGGSGNYGFAFYLVNNLIRLDHSPDGTTELSSSVTNPGLTNNTTYWLRATLDADNGAGGFTKRFYQSTDGTNWTQIGSDQVVSTGATSIFNTTYSWEIGSRGLGSSATLNAGSKIYEVDIKDGIDGTTIAPTLPDQWEPTGTGDVSFSGSPIIDIWNCSVPGITTRKQYDFRDMLRPRINSLVTFVALSHNDNYQTNPDYWKAWDALLDDIIDRNPITSVVLVAQNPRIVGTGTTNENIAAHAYRTRVLEAIAMRRGYGFVDIYQIYQDQFAAGVTTGTLIQSDGVHPNTAGYTLWGQSLADVWGAA